MCAEAVAPQAIKCVHCKSYLEGAGPAQGGSGRRVAFDEGCPCPGCGAAVSSRAARCRRCKRALVAAPAAGRPGLVALLLGVVLVIAWLPAAPLAVRGVNAELAYSADGRAAALEQAGRYRASASQFATAARRWAAAGNPREEALSREEQARCLRPDVDPGGSWITAGLAYKEAAEAWKRAGDLEEEADALLSFARCLRESGLHRGAREAVEVYATVARLYEDAGDPSSAAETLSDGAWAMMPASDAPQGPWGETAELFGRAAARYAELSADAELADALYWQGWCREPDQDPRGSWWEARALYARSAVAYRACGASWDEAYSHYREAFAALQGGAGPDEVAEALERAWLLAEEGDFEDIVELVAPLLAREEE